ncbi:hypothetical protein ACIBG8_44560 [Nonomuraea sp. NPDC050556]|uniref:hypothetical protein n=1 Tax=Nonomuraea sp. NPDC050556 TaxID=3364369 RepID=UPI0037B46903
MRRLLLVMWLLAAALVSGGTAGATAANRVALVGVPGLQWSDVDQSRTPNLWKLTADGGSASLSTRAVPPPNSGITCPVAGWLTVSAGQRAGSADRNCTLPPTPTQQGEGATVPGWKELAAFNAATSYQARIGVLGQTAGDVTAIGPGAALGAADMNGNVAHYLSDPAGLGDDYGLVVMEADALAKGWIGLGLNADGTPKDLPADLRKQLAAQADAQIGRLLARLTPGTKVLLAGVSDTTATAHLHVALATGFSGFLTSSSTRQEALVTNTDLTATTLQLLGLAVPEGVVGRAWHDGGGAPQATAARVTQLADADLASQVLREVRQPFFIVFVAVQLLFYLFAALAVRRRWGGARVLGWTKVVAVVSASVGVSTFLAQLVPWWSFVSPMASLIVTIVGFSCAIAALAFAGPWRGHVLGPLTVVASITSLALLLDVMTGSHLQVNAVTGYEPVTGGRFYGFGNIAFAVYSTGTILALAGIAAFVSRKVALVVCAAYGLLAIFADGWPGWGADFGGVPAFVLGFAVFYILLTGARVSIGKLAVVAGAGAVLIAGLAIVDWLRPAETRTHLGTFVQQFLDGQAWTVVGRKLGAMLGTLGNWQLTPLSLGALAFLFFVLARPSRWGASALSQAYALAPTLRAGLFGVLTCAFTGFLINDSGVAIPAMALTVAVPLALAASVRALQLATPTSPDPASAPAAPTAPPAP